MAVLCKQIRLREEHPWKLVRPQNAADLREREEWNEGYDQHQRARTDLISTNRVDIVQAAQQPLLVDPSLDEMLDNAKQQHEDAEQDRLVNDRHDERLVFEPSA